MTMLERTGRTAPTLIALALAAACASAPKAGAPPEAATPSPAATTGVDASASSAAPSVPVEPLAPAPSDVAPQATVPPAGLQPGELGSDEAELEETEPTPEPVTEAAPAPGALLHDSLDRYEASRASWEQGDLDAAFGELDEAYGLMSRVEPDGDPVLAQEKENLRQLISRRVVEIYASRQTAVGNLSASIPLVVNDDVQREIASFQGRERSFFLESYARSGAYRPMILEQLRAAGLPDQLSWLPLVESGFKERALSSARALGLWQFIPSTGLRYGLDRSDWIDERMDPEKATAAAIGYLTDLHGLLGDWLTALAAYNCGEGNVLKQIGYQKEGYFDQFWDLYARLPFETKRYVPRFLATLAILDDPAKYGFDLPEPAAPASTDTIEIARPVKLEALDAALGYESGTLARLNPELRRNATPKSAYTLRVPAGSGGTVVASLESIPEYTPPKVETGTHRVRPGETLGAIAARYRTSVKTLMSMNRLRSANRLSVGQTLRVPTRGGAVANASTTSAPARVAPQHVTVAAGETVVHRVRSGESLWTIASIYGTTPEKIRRDNGLPNDRLQIGQILRIVSDRDHVGG